MILLGANLNSRMEKMRIRDLAGGGMTWSKEKGKRIQRKEKIETENKYCRSLALESSF